MPSATAGLLVKRLLPEWASMVVGIPLVLGLYGWLIWRRGFGPEDRVLFRKQVDS